MLRRGKRRKKDTRNTSSYKISYYYVKSKLMQAEPLKRNQISKGDTNIELTTGKRKKKIKNYEE